MLFTRSTAHCIAGSISSRNATSTRAEDREIRQQRKDRGGNEDDGDELDAGDVEVVGIGADEVRMRSESGGWKFTRAASCGKPLSTR